MRRDERTPTSSPVKKKQRLSSPENTTQTSSQEHTSDAFDVSFVSSKLGFTKATASVAGPSNLNDDPDNPFTNQPLPNFGQAASLLPGFGFASASSIKHNIKQSRKRLASPEAQKDQDYEAWFKPPVDSPLVGFQTAGLASSSVTSPPIGFVSLRSKSTLAPSATALAKARERLKDIWDEDPTDTENIDPSGKPNEQLPKPTLSAVQPTFQRPALQSLSNGGSQTPGTPSPAGFSRPAIPATDQLKVKQKPFRSPLIRSTPGAGFVGSPLNPRSGFSSAVNVPQRAPTSMTPSTPLRPTILPSRPMALQTPTRAPAGSSTSRSTPAPFITPFKAGMRPGEPGWVKLQESMRKGAPQSVPRSPAMSASRQLNPSHQLVAKQFKTFFDLRPPPNRKTLATSGFRPQQFTQEDFENIRELQQVTPALAIYYSFHAVSTLPSQAKEPIQILGPEAALKEFHDQGCTLATKTWVDNHWGLILWKLAGMVALDPDSESDPATKRWCWAEVKRQLLYRYERELNQAKRPALRLISTQDAPAACPLALCVSNIFWLESGNSLGTTYPELEVTEGWYRLRAKIDAPMARAVKKGIIKIGRKIGVAGARLDSERKDPQEILEAYNSVKLVLTGNSSHLLPWDAKLGFMRGPCISTMHSLTPDGGTIAAMDVVVTKSHALGFIEYFVDTNGRQRREGPRGQAEEMKINDEWKKKREREASKLQTELEKKMSRYELYIDKLERRAGHHFHAHRDDEPPDHIETLYDQLEEHDDAMAMLSRITPQDAGWLAKHTHRCMELERERAGDEIERELEATCPPRDVRNFRVIVVQDSQTCRRPANRYAQLTVWDVLSLTLSEGVEPGTIKTGSRFLITNLIPQQQSAWMGTTKLKSQIFLTTTRSSKWRILK
ncbi:hypothetical protein P691DRAFT_754960 [Macrolepiota fuliginosa MF-IS2]|uniref:BRCA2 OB1 domain-containing protein n=1 Tax=Macrolepiota fuliginosa MF-IS2 TaxID=1400762 RepID=A0A9P5XNT3_9AGAR|nr:hypothetical protein P691DRAFT_754960 [Macrolepiota fuliginosa MF-IS2]